MSNHPKKERTFVIIKPDGIQRGLIGEITQRFEKVGLKITAMKMIMATEEQCWEHYKKDDAWFIEKGTRILNDRKEAGLEITKEAIDYGKEIIEMLVTYMTASPVIVMVIEGNNATSLVTKLVGATEPTTSDVGTIRGDYSLDSYEIAGIDERAVRNLIHCSEDTSEAEREIKIWFKEEEIISYRLIAEQMLYDVNLDGILE